MFAVALYCAPYLLYMAHVIRLEASTGASVMASARHACLPLRDAPHQLPCVAFNGDSRITANAHNRGNER